MSQKRKKLRKWCIDELPWRCQVNKKYIVFITYLYYAYLSISDWHSKCSINYSCEICDCSNIIFFWYISFLGEFQKKKHVLNSKSRRKDMFWQRLVIHFMLWYLFSDSIFILFYGIFFFRWQLFRELATSLTFFIS